MITLLVLQGPDKGRRFELPDAPALVGRESPNLKLNDTTCSRRHAELRPAGALSSESWVVRDLGSSNGTYVNGQRVFGQPVSLKLGDQLRVGKTLLLFGAQPGVSTQAANNVTFAGIESGMDSSILNTLPSNEDSMVLAVPEPAAAAMGNLKVLYRLAAALGSRFTIESVLEVVMDLIFETVKADRGIGLLFDESGELVPCVVRRRDEDEPDLPRRRHVSGPAARSSELAALREENGRHEPERSELRPLLSDGEDELDLPPETIHASRTIINHVLNTGEGVLSSNAMADKRFSKGKSVHDLGIRSALCVPIKARRLEARLTGNDTGDGAASENETLGVIYIDSSVRNYTYSVDQLRLLTAIGLQAGLAIQNAQLYRAGLQAERMAAIGETTAALSHSIKNILQGLRGGADVVEMGIKRRDLGQLSKGWSVVDRNLERIYNLTMNLLAYSRPREPIRRLIQPRALIEECLELLAPLANQKGVMAVADVAPDMPAVPLDPDGIHQVLMNLLTNALDAVEEETGLIRVVCRYQPHEKQTMMQIIDNGRGIHPNVHRHLFELFHSTKGNRGTGLGLPVARKIVEEHGGVIDVDSNIGEGTTFTILLPAFSEQIEDPAHTHGPKG